MYKVTAPPSRSVTSMFWNVEFWKIMSLSEPINVSVVISRKLVSFMPSQISFLKYSSRFWTTGDERKCENLEFSIMRDFALFVEIKEPNENRMLTLERCNFALFWKRFVNEKNAFLFKFENSSPPKLMETFLDCIFAAEGIILSMYEREWPCETRSCKNISSVFLFFFFL